MKMYLDEATLANSPPTRKNKGEREREFIGRFIPNPLLVFMDSVQLINSTIISHVSVGSLQGIDEDDPRQK
jgi:hypothetical protein